MFTSHVHVAIDACFAYTLYNTYVERRYVCGGFFYNNLGHLSHVTIALERHIQPCCMCTLGVQYYYYTCSFCALTAPAIEFFTSLDTPAHV